MTPLDIIASVRQIVKDDDATAYRYSNEYVRAACNRACRRISLVRPDLFTTIESFSTTDDTVQQEITDGRVIEVLGVVGGNAVTEVDREVMDQLVPDWRVTTSGTCVNWVRHPRSPSIFFVYPPAVTGQQLLVHRTKSPNDYALGDTIELDEKYFPAVCDLTVFEIEWSDDEHELSQRATMGYQNAMQLLGASHKAKALTDTEDNVAMAIQQQPNAG